MQQTPSRRRDESCADRCENKHGVPEDKVVALIRTTRKSIAILVRQMHKSLGYTIESLFACTDTMVTLALLFSVHRKSFNGRAKCPANNKPLEICRFLTQRHLYIGSAQFGFAKVFVVYLNIQRKTPCSWS